MAKKFISFLGTGKYLECSYQFKEKCGNKVIYIQEDLIDRFCTDFSEEDKIVIFLTKEARETHWTNKLEVILNSKGLKCNIDDVDINLSKTESDIWKLFEQIYSKIEFGDEIIFDLTHSFRYLPMLFFSVLHYASFIKKVSVKGIYYGAFDAKDSTSNIAPIFDLTDSFKIMEWANAADAFSNYGIADKLVKCVNERASDFIGSAGLARNILGISKDISYSRLISIAEGDKFKSVKKGIADLEDNLQPAFNPILETVSKKIEKFEEKSTLNFIPAVQWCIDHEMVPQGFTILQEGLLSYIIAKQELNVQDRILREILSNILSTQYNANYQPHSQEANYEVEINRIREDDFFSDELCQIYRSIGQSRNDVNHGGTGDNATERTEKLFNNLKKRFKEVKDLLKLD